MAVYNSRCEGEPVKSDEERLIAGLIKKDLRYSNYSEIERLESEIEMLSAETNDLIVRRNKLSEQLDEAKMHLNPVRFRDCHQHRTNDNPVLRTMYIQRLRQKLQMQGWINFRQFHPPVII